MIFKNAIHLLISHFGLTFKFLLYKVIVLAVAAALSAAFVYPTLQFLLSSAEFAAVAKGDFFGELLGALFSGSEGFWGSFSPEMQT